jgi:hypothetical protein
MHYAMTTIQFLLEYHSVVEHMAGYLNGQVMEDTQKRVEAECTKIQEEYLWNDRKKWGRLSHWMTQAGGNVNG